jgi:hypothetical protein
MILLYDDRCYYCTKFAMLVSRMSSGIMPIGLYSREGMVLKRSFPDGVDADEMFWLIDGEYAYGGLYGLLRLARMIITKPRFRFKPNHYSASMKGCEDSNSCSITSRLYTLLTKGRKIILVNVDEGNDSR